jgi:hypothetical protein
MLIFNTVSGLIPLKIFNGNNLITSNINLINFTGSGVTASVGEFNNLTITIGGGSGGTTPTGSLLLTASFSNPNLTFTKGDGSTFNVNLSTLVPTSSSYTLSSSYAATASIATSSSYAATASIATSSSYALSSSYSATASIAISSSYVLSSSYAATASIATSASYALNGGVTQLLAGPNIVLSPISGLGQVTVTANLSGSTIFNTATGSYGSFYDTTTQTNLIANIPRSMSFNNTDITNGVSISGSTSPFNTYIKTQNAGVYDIQFSAQLDKTDSGTDEIVIWLRKNGIDLTDTATAVTLVGNNAKNVAAWNWFVNSAANDYYQIIWQSPDTNVRLFAEPADGHPGIPSVIATVNRVDQFLSNTGSFSGSFNGSFTGSLLGTASYATNALSASFAFTASYVNNLNQAVTVGNITSIPSTENTLNIYPPFAGGTGEGGQILLAASGGLYTSASMIDNYQNQLRILKGTNTEGSTTGYFTMNLDTGASQFLGPVTASAYSGLPNDYLYVTRNTNQTIGSGTWANRDIIFNNINITKGIAYNVGTGLASLTGGKVYRITARLAWSAAAPYLLQYSCYTSADTQIGPTVEIVQSTNTSNNISDGTLDFIYAPGSNTDIKIRTTNNTSALTGEFIRGDLNTQLIIQQIA